MFDICAMLGIFEVTCSHCKNKSNSKNGKWRCRSCGSNLGSYRHHRYLPPTITYKKKHWWSRKEIVDEVKENSGYVTEEKRWESPPYEPEKEEKKESTGNITTGTIHV